MKILSTLKMNLIRYYIIAIKLSTSPQNYVYERKLYPLYFGEKFLCLLLILFRR